jgi:hypothetical protein
MSSTNELKIDNASLRDRLAEKNAKITELELRLRSFGEELAHCDVYALKTTHDALVMVRVFMFTPVFFRVPVSSFSVLVIG